MHGELCSEHARLQCQDSYLDYCDEHLYICVLRITALSSDCTIWQTEAVSRGLQG